MTRYGIVCGGELDNKKIKVTSTGRKDIYGKVIWESNDGKHWELEVTKHLGQTKYYLHETTEQ